MGVVALSMAALAGCTSVRMVQRDGCWLKQTDKWPGRVKEELAFCAKPAPQWAEDRVARLVQECMAQADYRWQSRALSAWNRGEPIPPQESDEKLSKSCVSEASTAIGPETEMAALKARLAELSQDRDALRSRNESDREFLEQTSEKMVSALGEAAKKAAPSVTATATSTGTATTDTDSPAPITPSTTVVGFTGPPMQMPAPRVVSSPATPKAKVNACAKPRKPAGQKVSAEKAGAGGAECDAKAKPATPAPTADAASVKPVTPASPVLETASVKPATASVPQAETASNAH